MEKRTMTIPTSSPTKVEQELEQLKKQNEKLIKTNTELVNKNTELEEAVSLHDSALLELVMEVFGEEGESL